MRNLFDVPELPEEIARNLLCRIAHEAHLALVLKALGSVGGPPGSNRSRGECDRRMRLCSARGGNDPEALAAADWLVMLLQTLPACQIRPRPSARMRSTAPPAPPRMPRDRADILLSNPSPANVGDSSMSKAAALAVTSPAPPRLPSPTPRRMTPFSR